MKEYTACSYVTYYSSLGNYRDIPTYLNSLSLTPRTFPIATNASHYPCVVYVHLAIRTFITYTLQVNFKEHNRCNDANSRDE